MKTFTSYHLGQIAFEIDMTAQGNAYHGNSLLVALDIPDLSNEDKTILKWALKGKYNHSLQNVALNILKNASDKELKEYSKAWSKHNDYIDKEFG